MAKADHDAAAAPDLLVAAFALIAEDGWDGLSFATLARRTGMPVTEVYRQLPTRGAVLRLLNRRIDQAMLEVDEAELVGLPPRDRAFELLMRRLEALVPFRPGLERLARVARRDPCVVLLTLCRLDRSLAWLQDVAGLRRHGLRARIARRALKRRLSPDASGVVRGRRRGPRPDHGRARQAAPPGAGGGRPARAACRPRAGERSDTTRVIPTGHALPEGKHR